MTRMFTTEFAVAAISTAPISPPTVALSIGRMSRPAVSATMAITATLKAIRSNGRCCAPWMTPVATSSSNAPAAQPYSTIAATAKTNVSETTPPLPSALIGTGKRSANVAAAVSAAREISVRPLCAVVPNSYAAAIRIPSPARQTGAIRRESRRGVTAWVLTVWLLPGELVGERLPGELPQQDCDQHQDGHESDQLWLPLQHP